MLEKLIAQFTEEFSLEDPLLPGEDKRYHLSFEDDVEIDLWAKDDRIRLKSEIGEIPSKQTDTFILKVLEANLFGMGTRDGVIGLAEDGKLLTLSLELEYTIGYKEFKEKLEDFISVIDFWRKEALKE